MVETPNADYVTLDVGHGGNAVLSHRPAVMLPDGTELPKGRAVHLLVDDGNDVAALILEPAEAIQLARALRAMAEGRILCAHADTNGDRAHWLQPGERCIAAHSDGSDDA